MAAGGGNQQRKGTPMEQLYHTLHLSVSISADLQSVSATPRGDRSPSAIQST